MDRKERLISNIEEKFDDAEFFLTKARNELKAGNTHEAWAHIDNILSALEEAEDWFETLESNDENDD